MIPSDGPGREPSGICPSAIELPPTEPIGILAWIAIEDGVEHARWSLTPETWTTTSGRDARVRDG
jgi:hypothetical protein